MAEEVKSGFTKEQKTGFVLLLVFAILGITLGMLEIRNRMFAPISLSDAVPSTIGDELNDVQMLKYRDTDHDGLSDFDERYTYGTSPYLFDTFDYGKSDKEVVAAGLPLCTHAGKDCADASTALSPTTTIPGPPEAPLDLSTILSDPQHVRQLLVENGVPTDTIRQVSDSDLMALVNDLMASSSFRSILNAASASSTGLNP